jgi:hypothetical protein
MENVRAIEIEKFFLFQATYRSSLRRQFLTSVCDAHSEISYLGTMVSREQHVGRLQITVNHVSRMKICHRVRNIEGNRKIFIVTSRVGKKGQERQALAELVSKTETSDDNKEGRTEH